MRTGSLTLPDGKRGQALAIGLTICAAALLWLGLATPLIGFYEMRAAQVDQQEQLLARMKILRREIPALRQAVGAAGLQSDRAQVLLTGNTDVIAGANLQSILHNLAGDAGTNLNSAALLPVRQVGSLRRIGMQVSVTTTWPVLIALLQAIGTARPYMIVDQVSLADTIESEPSKETPLQANFTVTGFRSAAP
jgi:general secretion pathway protein M